MTQLSDVEEWEVFFDTYLRKQITEVEQQYPKQRSLELEFLDLERYNQFATDLQTDPIQTLQVANEALNRVRDPGLGGDLFLRIVHTIPTWKVAIRDLRHHHLHKFISVEGIITRATEVRPKISVLAAECTRCDDVNYRPQPPFDFQLEWPICCELCAKGKANSTDFRKKDDLCERIDIQRLEIQENPEGMKGAQPARLWAVATNDLCHRVEPGSRVVLNGILRPKSRRVGGKESSVEDIQFEINSIEVQEAPFEEVEVSPEDEEKIVQLSKSTDLLRNMMQCIAPKIYGLIEEKTALVLQQFGGVRQETPGETPERGDIHILLVGDPGTGKSELLRSVSMAAPRSIHASGQSTSKAGLTATAVRDSDMDGQWVLNAGVLVLADMGIAVVDELDKMNDYDRAVMLPALEQQVIHIAKAGMNVTLQTRCSLLAAANPKKGSFDPFGGSFAEQVNMPPEYLDRFDCVFFIEDIPNRSRDEELAQFIIDRHRRGQAQMKWRNTEASEDVSTNQPITHDLFRKYVAYAKRHYHPKLSSKLGQSLVQYFASSRAIPTEHRAEKITTRTLRGLIRLAQASARMRLCHDVEEVDIERAILIIQHWMRRVHVVRDPNTSDVVDALIVREGVPDLRPLIRELNGSYHDGIPTDAILQAAKGDRSEILTALDQLQRGGWIRTRKNGRWSLS